jgi:Rrf2 family protein
MIISRKSKYAIKALQYLSRQEQGQPVLISEIAEKQAIPHKFLELILLELKKQELVTSRKGKGGGYTLAKQAEQLTLAELLRVIEGPYLPLPCLGNASGVCEDCESASVGCALKEVMETIRQQTIQALEVVTLAQLNERDIEISRQASQLSYYEI